MYSGKIKRMIITLGAGLAAASILAACSGAEKKEEDLKVSEGSTDTGATDQTGLEPAKPSEGTQAQTESAKEATESADAQTDSSGEAADSAEAAADVYGDGVDKATAKASENGLGFLRDQLRTGAGTMCGFAYLGSIGEGASVQDVIKSSNTAKSFTFINDMDTSRIIGDGGNDVFVFVPTDENAKVRVNTFSESDNGKEIYNSDKGTPFLIRTIDELNDSMEIVITDSVGNVGHFSPDIGMGSIVDLVYKDVTGYNFGTDIDGSNGLSRQYLLDTVLFREQGLNDLMAQGLTVSSDSYKRIYIDDLEFYTVEFGRESKGKFQKELSYAVSKDGNLVYRYNTDAKDWMDLLAFDFNAEQYR